jgi:hypothetical protein
MRSASLTRRRTQTHVTSTTFRLLRINIDSCVPESPYLHYRVMSLGVVGSSSLEPRSRLSSSAVSFEAIVLLSS